jgi:sulfur carrier protein
VKVIVNGKTTDTEEKNLREFILSRRLEPGLVIVELNERVVKRDKWPDTTLKEGDRLELVSLVGGG